MRRLYVQKNKITGSRGMVSAGWLCENCGFSDIITMYRGSETDSAHEHALSCACQVCGTTHHRGPGVGLEIKEIDFNQILEKLSRHNAQERIECLLQINGLEDPSEYLGLVLGVFIWDSRGDVRQIAKAVYMTSASHSQREIINVVWKERWRSERLKPFLSSKRFMKRANENLIDLEQLLGLGLILNPYRSAGRAILEMMEFPEAYLDIAIEKGRYDLAEDYARKAAHDGNYRPAEKYQDLAEKQVFRAIEAGNCDLAVEYTRKAIREGKNELAEIYALKSIEGENYDIATEYVELKGPEATGLLVEHFGRASKRDAVQLCEALVKTRAPEAARVLLVSLFEGKLAIGNVSEIGDENSEDPLIMAMAVLSGFSHSINLSRLLVELLARMDDARPLEFILDYYTEPEEKVRLFREVLESPSDKKKIGRYIRKAAGISSRTYKDYLLNKEPAGVRKFLLSDDPALRLMGVSMAKSLDLEDEMREFVFVMSLSDPDESVREAVTELVKGIDTSRIRYIFDSEGNPTFDYRLARPAAPHRKEILERLIGYGDPRFLTIIIDHIEEFPELHDNFRSLLESLYSKEDQIIDTLLGLAAEKAPHPSARTAVMRAWDLNELGTRAKVKEMMKTTKVGKRTERKQAVNRRMMFIDIFGQTANAEDLPYIQELMKMDRSPRAKRKFEELILSINTQSA